MALRRLLAAAAILLAVSLIAHLPARLFLTDGPVAAGASVGLDRIRGHWRAGALRALLPHPAPTITVSWQQRSLRLLRGQLRYALSASGAGFEAMGQFTLSPTELPTLDLATADWRTAGMPLLGPFRGSASFSAQLRDLHLVADATTVSAASGRLMLRALRIETLGQDLILGDFSATLDAVDGALHLAVVSDDALLEVGGDLYLSLDGHLWGELILRPDARTPEALALGVTTIGRPLSEGRYRIGVELQL
jgi:type II secretion system (T2SS) protein N